MEGNSHEFLKILPPNCPGETEETSFIRNASPAET